MPEALGFFDGSYFTTSPEEEAHQSPYMQARWLYARRVLEDEANATLDDNARRERDRQHREELNATIRQLRESGRMSDSDEWLAQREESHQRFNERAEDPTTPEHQQRESLRAFMRTDPQMQQFKAQVERQRAEMGALMTGPAMEAYGQSLDQFHHELDAIPHEDVHARHAVLERYKDRLTLPGGNTFESFRQTCSQAYERMCSHPSARAMGIRPMHEIEAEIIQAAERDVAEGRITGRTGRTPFLPAAPDQNGHVTDGTIRPAGIDAFFTERGLTYRQPGSNPPLRVQGVDVAAVGVNPHHGLSETAPRGTAGPSRT